MGNSKFIYYVRILAGAYICYIAAQLIMGVAKGEETSMSPFFAIFMAVVFILCGAYFAISSIIYLIKHRGESDEPPVDDLSDLKEEESRLEFMAGKSESQVEVEEAREEVKEAEEALKEKEAEAAAKAEEAKATAKEVVTEVPETTTEATEKVTEVAEEAPEKVAETATDAPEKTEEVSEEK